MRRRATGQLSAARFWVVGKPPLIGIREELLVIQPEAGPDLVAEAWAQSPDFINNECGLIGLNLIRDFSYYP